MSTVKRLAIPTTPTGEQLNANPNPAIMLEHPVIPTEKRLDMPINPTIEEHASQISYPIDTNNDLNSKYSDKGNDKGNIDGDTVNSPTPLTDISPLTDTDSTLTASANVLTASASHLTVTDNVLSVIDSADKTGGQQVTDGIKVRTLYS
jgi:hypothetical protein